MSDLRATYRVQMHAGFNFRQATALIPYWQKLGISHIYSSPWLRARHGSTHGYDLVDPTELNPQLGTETDRVAFIQALRDAGMGLLLDFVPNHMAASAENWRWDDVLTHGPSSKYARWFDIDWRSSDPELRGRVLLPVLGDSRHKAIARGELQLKAQASGIRLAYYDHSFPLDPPSLGRVLRFISERVSSLPQQAGGEFAEFRAVVHLLRTIPPRNTPQPKRREERRLKWSEAQARLRRLLTDSQEIGDYVDNLLGDYGAGENGRERMASLLDRQVYRLAFWRRAAREINYRRFFDINDLIGVRIGDPEVFEEFHSLVFRWIAAGEISALRIDHIDGLQDPAAYLQRLRERLQQLSPQREVPVYVEKILGWNEPLPKSWPIAGTTGYEFAGAAESIFIDPQGAEKIEAGYRRLTRERRTFAQLSQGAKRRVLRNDLSAYTGRLGRALSDISSAEGWDPLITPQQAIEGIITVIAALPVYRTYIDEHSEKPSAADGFVLEQTIERAKSSRARHSDAQDSPAERPAEPGAAGNLDEAPPAPGSLPRETLRAIDFLADVLLMKSHAVRSPADRTRRMRFILRFQQLCVAAAAKGIEDTAFYLHVPLVSRNEVGGEPADTLQDAMQRLHIANATRAANFPRSLLTVTTHDTKRGADVRARIDVLSEIPHEWLARVARWRQLNKPVRRKIGGRFVPDDNTEYLFYQTVVGVWPNQPRTGSERHAPASNADRHGSGGNAVCHDCGGSAVCHCSVSSAAGATPELRERIQHYMLKAVREAKRHTSWVDPNEGFEAALAEFVERALPQERSEFTAGVDDFVRLIGPAGALNSLARTLIQFTSPGVPDLYQGDELWNFVLVDPDNRRPVDWESRRNALAVVEQMRNLSGFTAGHGQAGGSAETTISSRQENPAREHVVSLEDRTKLYVIHRALELRAEYPDLFSAHSYQPLQAVGPRASHVFAFARWSGDQMAITLVGRLMFGKELEAGSPQSGFWSGTRLLLPVPLRAETLRCRVSGRDVQPTGTDAAFGIDLDQAFDAIPLALLAGRRQQPA